MNAPLQTHTSTDQSSRFGMVIDLNRCVGCQTCTAACKHANDTTPGVQWRQVVDLEFGTFPDVQRLFLVTGCQHCDEPPCVPVCPTGATFAREDGLVVMNYDDCIGCGYCAVACPYQARTIAHEQRGYFEDSAGETTRQERVTHHEERQGVAQKCTFCVDRIDEAAASGKIPGVDLEVTPACSSSCIAQAIHFGDFDNPQSNVSQLLAENHVADMHAGLGTKPQIRYLLDTPAVEPRTNTIAEPAEGPLQQFWDHRAACNFIFGGAASGLIVISFVAWLLGELPERALTLAYATAAVLMVIGLGAVFLEIGRKLRSLQVFTRVNSSWMSREAWAAVVVVICVVLDLFWPSVFLHVLIAVAGAVFLYCQARILHAARGIPAWRVPEMPSLLVSTGLLEGAGLLAICSVFAGGWLTGIATLGVCGATLAVMTGVLWMSYTSRAQPDYSLHPNEPVENRFGLRTREALENARWPVSVVGHILPFLAVLIGMMSVTVPGWLLVAGGALGILAGATLKATLVTRAAYQQGISLPALPGRGSGHRAAQRRDGFAR